MNLGTTRARSTLRIPLLLACLAPAPAALAAAPEPATRPAESRPAAATAPAGSVAVAVLDFESNAPGSPDLGKQIAEVLVASLSGEQGFQLVDRAAMANVLREHELNLTGLVKQADAAKVGKVVGARILITGKAFAVDKQLFITAKLIGTETTLVDGVVVKGPREADTGDLLMGLAQKLADRLRTAGPKLVAADDVAVDPLPALKAKLAGRKLPIVGVSVAERHVGATAAVAGGIDPAVDTEVKSLFVAAGFTVIDGTERDWDRGGVELAVTGEAFSEFNVRIGNLTSCSGRTEVKAVNRKDNSLVFSDRTTTRAVDLAENTAGKTALQKGGRELALRLLQHLADTLPAAEKAK